MKKSKKQKSGRYRVLIITAIIIGFAGFLLITRQYKIYQQTKTQPAITQQNNQTNNIDLSVCDPKNGNFTVEVDNPYFRLPVGINHIIEDKDSKVQIRVLDQTETVAGIPTRVVEEREWEDGVITEISRNFFVQASDGTVCYYGEDVDIYENGLITKHEGAWRAGEGQNKPGIVMPAKPAVGQKYFQEQAPGVATDFSEHIAIEKSFTTSVGTFHDVLVVKETPPSTKRYAPGLGLIYDDGAVITQY